MNFNLPFPEIYPIIHSAIKPTTHLYLVGGCVRDLLLNREPQDIDLVLSADVKSASRRLANEFQGDVFSLDDERNTMRVLISTKEKKWKLDIAALRGENLKQDLITRDFRLNAMAIEVLGDSSTQIIDFLNGQSDIENHELRLCSETSIEDDPIRILRGVRLALSLDFSLSTEAQAKMKASSHLLDTISAERKRDELFKLFEQKNSSIGMMQLSSLGILDDLFPESSSLNLSFEQQVTQLLSSEMRELNNFVEAIKQYLSYCFVDERSTLSLIKIVSLYANISNTSQRIGQFSDKFALSNRERNYMLNLSIGLHQFNELLSMDKEIEPKDIYRYYKNIGEAGVGACLLMLADTVSDKSDQKYLLTVQLFDAYFNHHEKFISVLPILSGDDLIKLFKLSPGPQFKNLLEALKEAQVTGEVSDFEQAKKFIKQLL